MAALANGAVTVLDSFLEVTVPLERRRHVKHVEVVLTGQGGAANTISAANFGFNTIFEVSLVQTDDNSAVYAAAPSYDGTKLFLYDLSNATDASRDAPADITDTVRFVIKGR